jgi:hypothetical protein
MGTVQYIFLAIGLTIMFVGLARGYDKELGNSIILMITIAVFGFFEARYETRLVELAGSVLGVQNSNVFLFLFYSLIFIGIVFSSYNGITFNYGGKPVTGLGGQLISLGVGLFNGYLIAGTLWYYANKFGYPLLNVSGPVTGGAVEVLPPTVFPDPLYWVVPAAVLLVLRVRG